VGVQVGAPCPVRLSVPHPCLTLVAHTCPSPSTPASQILARRTKNNPILLGEPGVGKTAIAEGLAYAIVHKTRCVGGWNGRGCFFVAVSYDHAACNPLAALPSLDPVPVPL
jgi:hypothetical protein